MTLNERERWQTAVADKAVRAALDVDDVREALIAHKVDKTPRTRHDLVTALSSAGVTSSRERDRIVAFFERTPKFDVLVSESLLTRLP